MGFAPYSSRHVDSLQDQIRNMVERRPTSFRHTEENAMSETDRLIEMVKYFAMSDKNTCWPAPTRWSLKEAKETLLKQAELAAAERLMQQPRFER